MNHEYILQKQKEIDNKRLETLLIEGLESGKPVEINKEWKKKREELIQRLQKQKQIHISPMPHAQSPIPK